MLIMGLSGGPSLVSENILDLKFNMFHDAAATLIKDGEILVAIEEERLNRIKHTNKAPVSAIRMCLDEYNFKLSDIDKFVIYFEDKTYKNLIYSRHKKCMDDYRQYVNRYLYSEFGEKVDKDKIVFTPHHLAHAASTFLLSGFEEALVVILDGAGDNSAGMVISYKKNRMEVLYNIPILDSLGFFYLDVTKILGYNLFDEYKIMGLAPYGRPEKYRNLFKKFYVLLPEGKYKIKNLHKQLLYRIISKKANEETISQIHKDIAASLQEALETIVLHILTYFQKITRHRYLCMAGGIAHNCKNNGKILYSNLFEAVFIQPASHDAGCALGAAMLVGEQSKSFPLEHVYWGVHIGNDNQIEKKLKYWSPYISCEYMNDKYKKIATFLSKGNIIGWVQGRSEFGPRALGNRSILADPRPSENKEIINSMVKKREAYRPFAPAIMDEYLNEYFDVPTTKCNYSFMTYAINVRKEMRNRLGATTHVDGTARVQTVHSDINPEFWKLLYEFNKITRLPLLLNTSFNNFAEPIVDSVDDAITCFLTTGLHYLVIGNFLITKNYISDLDFQNMKIIIPKYVEIIQIYKFLSSDKFDSEYIIRPNYNNLYSQNISQNTYSFLHLIGNTDVRIKEVQLQNVNKATVWEEIKRLWENRLINLIP